MKIQIALFFAALCLVAVQAKTFGKNEVDFSGYCSDESIPPGSTYWQSLNLTLTDVINNTPNATNLTYSAKHGTDGVTAYGQGICFNLGHDGCKDCISNMVRRAWEECSDAIAVMLVLTGKCAIRYQDTPLSTGPAPPPVATPPPGPPKM